MAFEGLSRKAMAVPLAWAVLALSVGCAVTPTPPTATETSCSAAVIDRSARWREIGGPNAFIVAHPFVAHDRFAQKIWVRFEEPSEEPLSIEAALLGAELREDGVVQAAIEPGQWAPGAGPPEDLPGSVHLAIIQLPRPGCWELVLRAGSSVVGQARIEVQPMASPTHPASGDVAPTPTTISGTSTPPAPPSEMPTPGAGQYVGILDLLDDTLTCLGAWIREGPDVPAGDWFELRLPERYTWTRSDGFLAIKDAAGLLVARELDWVLIAGKLDPAAGSFCMSGRQILASQVTSYGSSRVGTAP